MMTRLAIAALLTVSLTSASYQRNFYEELAGYYGQVAADFRHVIAKQGNGRPSIYSERR